jgi:hypothetical protein
VIESGSKRLLELLNNPVARVVPKGWKTLAQICVDIGLSDSQTGKLVRKAVEDGVLEKRMFRITTNSVTRPVAHYKPRKG